MSTRVLFYLALPFGFIAGLSSLPWMWVILLCWIGFLLIPSRPAPACKIALHYGFFLHNLFCAWGGFQLFVLPPIQSMIFVPAVLTILLIGIVLFLIKKRRKPVHGIKQPITPPLSTLSLYPIEPVWTMTVSICGLSCIGHGIIALWSGLTFSMGAWLNVAFVLVLLRLLYPSRSQVAQTWIPLHGKPILVLLSVGLIGGHAFQFTRLSKQALDATESAATANAAVQAGYTHTAVQAALTETARWVSADETGNAILYLRATWEHLPKEQIAAAFRRHPSLHKNAFLFLSLFGGRLPLQDSEEIVDGVLMQEPNSLSSLLATDTGRLLKIHAAGVTALPLSIPGITRLRHEPTHNRLYGLTRHQTVFFIQAMEVRSFELPRNENWVDGILSASGDLFWGLHARGGIGEWINHNGEWRYSRELYPPLWQQAELAIRLLYETVDHERVFYILDNHKGITARYPQTLQHQVLPKKDLYHYFHPQRNTAVDAVLYKTKILIADVFGQMDIIHAGIGDEKDPWKNSIRANTWFDRESGIWMRDPNTAALLSFPQANSVWHLKRNGIIEAVAMPQGFRIPQLKRNREWLVSPSPPSP